MPNRGSVFGFLRGAACLAVTSVLVLEIAGFYSMHRAEFVPHPPALQLFPRTLEPWRMIRQTELDPETQEFLRADDTLNRTYDGPDGPVYLFVAFFRSQREGVTPHSPKVCLPGTGWTPESSRIVSVDVAGNRSSIPVNRYLVRHGEDRSLVLYWYQSAHFVMANEYLSKLYLIYGGLRYNRSDEALVRVISPIENDREDPAVKKANDFIRLVYRPLCDHLWAE